MIAKITIEDEHGPETFRVLPIQIAGFRRYLAKHEYIPAKICLAIFLRGWAKGWDLSLNRPVWSSMADPTFL